MDALEKAKQEMTGAEQFAYEEISKDKVAFVMAYAAIAQAEQLGRIADLLERFIGPSAPADLEVVVSEAEYLQHLEGDDGN